VNNEGKKVLFIINKFSGRGYLPDVDGKIIEACDRADVECSIEFTNAKSHATELAREAARSGVFSLVVAVGGDGTVNEVANGLIHSSVCMGILPKGSGNGLARHLGIPMNISEGLATLFNSQEISMDTFLINGKLSLNVSGIGFDGHVANIFGNNKKRGLQGYTRVTLNEFMKFEEFEVRVTTAQEVLTRKAFIVAIANSSQYGNNARIAPAASVCDELLHVCFLKKVPPYRLDFIYSFFAGKIEETAYCEIIETKHMNIHLNTPVAFHVDGEPCGVADKFQIDIQPHSLKMLVPASSLKY
jgi:diacylglycerol kinase (ATP)